MSKRKMQDNDFLLNNLSKETQIIVAKFLAHYKGKGKLDYKSAILRMLNNEMKKVDAKEINFEDYIYIKQQMWPDESESKSTQFSLRESFIKYLYAFEYLKEPMGFEKIFIKDNLIKWFENKLTRKSKKVVKKYKPHLTIEQINAIETILNVIDDNDIIRLKEAFSWYMLFYTECSINTLRSEIKGENYINGNIVLEDGTQYIVPHKFVKLFEYLRTRTYTGYDLDATIHSLGKRIRVNTLKPGDIRKARNENLILCQSCGDEYLNTIDNWKAINGRIICTYCAQELKKNYNVNITDINSENIIEDITNNIENSSIYYTYEQIKSKLNKQINYLDLHKYLIQIGNLGEAFVYDHEKNKLRNTAYETMVDNTPALNPINGYDIKSYERSGEDIYIEVKTTTNFDETFYISEHELKTAKRYLNKNKSYYIYRVYNILAENKEDVKIKIIKNIVEDENYIMSPFNYKVELKEEGF